MRKEPDHSCVKAAETITLLQRFMKDAPRELGLSWAAFVILGALASPGVAYLSSTEIIQSTGLNRGWGYQNIRMLLRKGLVDSVEQRGPCNHVRTLYALNGKGAFYLTQALRPNGVSMIKTLLKD
jgi:DNA-binding PadR family transcriptional regulator